MPTGYGNAAYVRSLSHLGRPRFLQGSGGHLLVRSIEPERLRDAVGPYPVFTCARWDRLADDLIDGDLVSVTIVADPLRAPPRDALKTAFPDGVTTFKQHRVVDLTRPLELSASAGHRRHVRRALESVVVERVNPSNHLREWCDLYAHLSRRHRMSAAAQFDDAAFALQLQTPGLVGYRARRDGATVAMQLWMREGECAWYHLGASDDVGYSVSASYAVMWTALDDLRADGVIEADLGSSAGPVEARDGLARFKRGWTKHVRPARLCRRICDRDAYAELVASRGIDPDETWFPAYRAGEAP